jgi:uncharacterized protein YdaT
MPWTGKQFAARHNHGLKGKAADHAAKVANAILERTGDEGMAIAMANKRARNYTGSGQQSSKSAKHTARKTKTWVGR